MKDIIKRNDDFTIPLPGNEQILLEYWSNGWDRYMPVTIIRYKNDRFDLHCQTGDHHNKAIREAKKILQQYNLVIDENNGAVAPTGLYYSLKQID